MMDELMEGAIEALFVSHKRRAKKLFFSNCSSIFHDDAWCSTFLPGIVRLVWKVFREGSVEGFPSTYFLIKLESEVNRDYSISLILQRHLMLGWDFSLIKAVVYARNYFIPCLPNDINTTVCLLLTLVHKYRKRDVSLYIL